MKLFTTFLLATLSFSTFAGGTGTVKFFNESKGFGFRAASSNESGISKADAKRALEAQDHNTTRSNRATKKESPEDIVGGAVTQYLEDNLGNFAFSKGRSIPENSLDEVCRGREIKKRFFKDDNDLLSILMSTPNGSEIVIILKGKLPELRASGSFSYALYFEDTCNVFEKAPSVGLGASRVVRVIKEIKL